MNKIFISALFGLTVATNVYAEKFIVTMPMICETKKQMSQFTEDIGEKIQLTAKAYNVNDIKVTLLFSFDSKKQNWTMYFDIPTGERCVAAIGEEGFNFK
jgi:hypothetical protein